MADELLALRMGKEAATLIHQSRGGTMVSLKDGQLQAIPLGEVVGKKQRVPQQEIDFARSLLALC